MTGWLVHPCSAVFFWLCYGILFIRGVVAIMCFKADLAKCWMLNQTYLPPKFKTSQVVVASERKKSNYQHLMRSPNRGSKYSTNIPGSVRDDSVDDGFILLACFLVFAVVMTSSISLYTSCSARVMNAFKIICLYIFHKIELKFLVIVKKINLGWNWKHRSWERSRLLTGWSVHLFTPFLLRL